MRLLQGLVLGCLAGYAHAVFRYMERANQMIPLKKYSNDKGYTGGNGKVFWYNWVQVLADVEMNIEELFRVASAHYNWLYDQHVQGRESITFGTGGCLLSALWIEETRTVYLATFPRGPYKRLMAQDATSNAPIWEAHVKRLFTTAQPLLHVEDAVYHVYEWINKKEGTPVQAQGSNEGYPEGTMIATWGFHAEDDDKLVKHGGGRPVNLCSDPAPSKRGASCQQVADSLGVYYEDAVSMPQDEAKRDSDSDADGEDQEDAQDSCSNKMDVNASKVKRYGPHNNDWRNRRRATSSCDTADLDDGPMTVTPEPAISTISEVAPSSSNELSSSGSSTITAPPSGPSCYHQDATPGNGASSAYCVCDKTITLPELILPTGAVVTQSCDYTALPTSVSKTVSIKTSTYTIDCQACTGVGGIENQAGQTCTKIVGCTMPTFATAPSTIVWLSNNTVSVGTANNAKNGSDLLHQAYSGTRALCNGKTCVATKDQFSIPNVPTVIANSAGSGRVDDIELGFTISVANFTDINQMERMLARGVIAWQQYTAQSCKTVPYQQETDDACDNLSPIKRDQPELFLTHVNQASREEARALSKRTKSSCERSLDGGCDSRDVWCSMETTLCSGPDSFMVVEGYSGLLVTVEHVEKKASLWDKFICDLVELSVEALENVMPELLPLEEPLDISLKVECEDVLENLGIKQMEALASAT